MKIMSKVKITDIKKVLKGKIGVTDLGIEVKNYISLAEKNAIVNIVKDAAIQEYDLTTSINYISKKLFTEISIIKKYTNIDFSTVDKIEDLEDWNNKIIEYFDLLKETGVVKYVIDQIPKDEYYELLNFINSELNQEVKISDSIATAKIATASTEATIDLGVEKINDGLVKIGEEVEKLIASMPKNPKELGKMIDIFKNGFIKKDE